MSRNELNCAPALSEMDETVLAYIEENFGKKAAGDYRKRLVAFRAGVADSNGSERVGSRSRAS